MTMQREVVAQPRVKVLDQRTTVRRLCHGLTHCIEKDTELVPHLRSKLVLLLRYVDEGARQTLQHAGFTYKGFGGVMILRDGSQLFVKHASKGKQVVALIL
jgi:hypothetical protein